MRLLCRIAGVGRTTYYRTLRQSVAEARRKGIIQTISLSIPEK